MIKVPDSEDLCDFDLRNYAVPAYRDTRGFLYILYDSIFPDYIKVGRTSDCRKRLQGYNSDKPYPTAQLKYISRMFENVNTAERKILEYLYDNTSPTTLSREWFEYQHKEMIVNIIEKAEKEIL